MIDEIITKMHNITKQMLQVLKDGDFAEFEKMLSERHELMNQMEAIKTGDLTFHYSPKAKSLIEEMVALDRLAEPLLKSSLSETQISLNQIKVNKEMSKRYQPYMKQMNGAFLDEKK